MQIKFESFSDVLLEMGAIFSNSLVPLEVVGRGALPVDEVVVETPSPPETDEPVPTATPPALPADVIPRAPVEHESIASSPSAATVEGNSAQEAGGMTSGSAPPTEPSPTIRPKTRPRGDEPDEVVFGEVIKR